MLIPVDILRIGHAVLITKNLVGPTFGTQCIFNEVCCNGEVLRHLIAGNVDSVHPKER